MPIPVSGVIVFFGHFFHVVSAFLYFTGGLLEKFWGPTVSVEFLVIFSIIAWKKYWSALLLVFSLVFFYALEYGNFDFFGLPPVLEHAGYFALNVLSTPSAGEWVGPSGA
jgi:hypothetical protein